MNFGGKYLFLASRSDVWTALNTAEMLKAAIPGCTRIDWVSETSLEAAITVDLKVAKPEFVGDLVLSNVIAAERYTLTGRGRGGLLGRVHGEACISLQDDEKGCILSFEAIGGASKTLMNLGRPLIGASAQRVIDHFFERFAAAMPAEIVTLPRDEVVGADPSLLLDAE